MSDPEVAAVENALNTLALAESDAAFQKVVSKLLPAVLAALATKSPAARAKCIETLQHINVRLRAYPSLQLPFAQVLRVATDPAAAVFTANVAIQGGYLSRCFHRLPAQQQAQAFPSLVEAALGPSAQANRDAVHRLAIDALAAASTVAAAEKRSRSTTDTPLWDSLAPCPQESVYVFFSFALRALRKQLPEPVSEHALMAIVKLASEYAGSAQPNRAARVFPLFLVAAGTASLSELMALGEGSLKKVDKCDVLVAEDPTMVDTLFQLFNDTLAEIPLRAVILSKGLLNVTLSASCFPEVLQVIKHSLHTPGIPPRLQGLGMQFVTFVFTHADRHVLIDNVSALVDLLVQLAVNETHGSPSFPDAVRAFGFTALGQLVVRLPSVFGSANLSSDFFFDAAQAPAQPPQVRTAAGQALVAMARVLDFDLTSNVDVHNSVVLTLKRTLDNLDDIAVPARRAAVHWANECFPFADPDARLLDMIAASDVKQDIRQVASAGLSPKRWNFADTSIKRKVDEKAKERPSLSSIVDVYSRHIKDCGSCSPKTIESFLKFAFYIVRHCVVIGGKLELAIVDDADRYIDNSDQDRIALVELSRVADQVLLELSEGRSSELEKAALSVILFTSNSTALKKNCAERYVSRIDDLLRFAVRKSAAGDLIVVRAVAKLVAAACDELSESDVSALVEKLRKCLEPDSSGIPSGRSGEDRRVANILCIGQIIVRCRRRFTMDDSECSSLSKACLDMTRRVLLPVESIDIVRIAACFALSDVGASGPLPISSASRKRFVTSLVGISKSHNTAPKLVLAAADTIGRVCIGEPRLSFRKIVGEALLQLCKERKEDDIHYVAAESLARSSSGFNAPPPVSLKETNSQVDDNIASSESETLQSVLLMRTEAFEINEPIDDFDDEPASSYGVEEAIREAIKLVHDERPTARAGGCVCLFTILSLLGKNSDGSSVSSKVSFKSRDDELRFEKLQDSVLSQLRNIQVAFTILLGDRSEFVQQLASCGVALAYQMCPRESQHDLVTTLVRSLTAGKSKSASVVPGDQGSLLELRGVDVDESSCGAPKSATYKELCSLAQDMGQPELVYKFMDLAGHAALWNSRKGAALASSALLGSDMAAEQLRPHLMTLLPRLYVYCYDPTENVRIAMGSVLGAVIKSAGLGSVFEAVTEHFDLVTEYCMKMMSSRQWRSREAGCGALRDTLTSRTWEQVKKNLSEFWLHTLRALDDIKESVRKAAEGTGRALSELSVHLCDPSFAGVDIAREASAVVIPAVMSGVAHKEENIRTLAGSTMTKLIRYGGEALRSSVAELVSMLLEAASELEPQMLNYAQFHVDDPSHLEDLRVSAASTSASPLTDSLERLSGLVDESNAQDTVRALVRLSKVGVGIPTRAATARFYSTLLRGRAVVLEPYAAKVMWSAVSASGMEYNAMLRDAWCSAAGIAARLCDKSAAGEFVDHVSKIAGSEDHRDRLLGSCLAAALWQQSPDLGRQHASLLLPLAYMGAHETEEEGSDGSAKKWKEVWNEGAPSTEAGLRHYAKEITDICEKRLKTSAQYRVKRSAAAALGALAKASNESVDVIYVQKAGETLVGAVPGHIWDGKIVVIEALGHLAEGYKKETVWAKVGGVEQIVRLLLGESKRGKNEYKLAAIDAVTKVLMFSGGDANMFGEVFEAVSRYWTEGSEGNAEEGTDISRMVWETGTDTNAVDARTRARKARRQLCVASVKGIGASFRGGGDELEVMITVAETAMRWEWEVRVATLGCMGKALKTAGKEVMDGKGSNFVGRILAMVKQGIMDGKYAAVRHSGYECIISLGECAGWKVLGNLVDESLNAAILQSRAGDLEPAVQAMAKRVGNLLPAKSN